MGFLALLLSKHDFLALSIFTTLFISVNKYKILGKETKKSISKSFKQVSSNNRSEGINQFLSLIVLFLLGLNMVIPIFTRREDIDIEQKEVIPTGTEVTYYFDSGATKEPNKWTTDAINMWDGDTGNYSSTSTSGDIQLLNDNSYESGHSETITKVELRAFGYWTGGIGENLDIYLRPKFGGSTFGDYYRANIPEDSGDWGDYLDITNDDSAPPWTWIGMEALDCEVHANFSAVNDDWYCSKVEIRVTYSPADITGVVLNFAGNLGNSGGPYWNPTNGTGESLQLTGDFSDGYYANDSRQSEDWIYVNVSVLGAITPTNVYLNWLNDTDWTNDTYTFTDRGNGYWDINTSGTITNITSGYDYSFDVKVVSGTTWYVPWNKTGIGGGWTRRYVQLDNPTVNISYEPFYLVNYTSETSGVPPYGIDDSATKDRMHHDQGPGTTLNDTGFLSNETLTDTMHMRHCSGNTIYFFENSVCVQNDIIETVYYHVWGSSGTGDFDINVGKSRGNGLWSGGSDTGANRSTIVWDNGETPSNDYFLRTGLYDGADKTISDNDVYEFHVLFGAGAGQWPSMICNQSVQSFVIFNLPSNASLGATDTDSDGLTDVEELWTTYTNPFDGDTDSDGVDDDTEVNTDGTDPNNYTDFIAEGELIFDVSLPFPSNNSQHILTSTENLTVNIDLCTSWNISVRSNETGSFVAYAENNSCTTNGTKYCDISGELYFAFNKSYTWFVNATDGDTWINKTYYFTTFNGSGFVYKDNTSLGVGTEFDYFGGLYQEGDYVFVMANDGFDEDWLVCVEFANETIQEVDKIQPWETEFTYDSIDDPQGIDGANFIHSIFQGCVGDSPPICTIYIGMYEWDEVTETLSSQGTFQPGGSPASSTDIFAIANGSTNDRLFVGLSGGTDYIKVYDTFLDGTKYNYSLSYSYVSEFNAIDGHSKSAGVDYLVGVNASDDDIDLLVYNGSGNYELVLADTYAGTYSDVFDDGEYIYAISADGMDVLSINTTLDELHLEYEYDEGGTTIASSGDSRYVGDDGELKSYLFQGGEFIFQDDITMINNTADVYELAVVNDNNVVFAACKEGGLHAYGYELLRVAPPVINLVIAGNASKDSVTRDGVIRYVNQSYNNETFCNVTANVTVPNYRTMGRYFQTTDDNVLIASGDLTDDDGWYDEKNHSLISSMWECTYTGEYSQISAYLIGSGNTPPWVGYAIYDDNSGEPGNLLAFTERDYPGSDFFADEGREAYVLYFPPSTRIWHTQDIAYNTTGASITSIALTEGENYWIVMATNDTVGWGYQEDVYWLLGNSLGDTSHVKTALYNISSDMNFSNVSSPVWVEHSTANYACIYAIANSTYNSIPTVDISSATLKWYNDSVNTVNYTMTEMGNTGNWTFNVTNLDDNVWYTFDIVALDELNNDVTYEHFRSIIQGDTERIEFQCNVPYVDEADHHGYNTTSTLYRNDSVLYLWNRTYATNTWWGDDEQQEDALAHEQGVDGTIADSGGWEANLPDDTLQVRHCLKFAGGWWDENITVEDEINLTNVYIHWWGAGGVNWDTMRIHYGRSETLYNFDWLEIVSTVGDDWNYLELNTNESTKELIVDATIPVFDSNDLPVDIIDPSGTTNSLRLISEHINLSNTLSDTIFDSGSIYGFFIGYDKNDSAYYWEGSGAGIINNRSYLSYVIFNVPENATLNATGDGDSDDDGLSDWQELYKTYTHPFITDTDNDGYLDNDDAFPNNFSAHQGELEDEYPANESTGIGFNPKVNVTVKSGTVSDINWYTNASGSWQPFGTANTSVTPRAVYSTAYYQDTTAFVDDDTTYWWAVNVSYGDGFLNETYHFLTKSYYRIASGFFSFTNSSTTTLITTGFFTFGNTAQEQLAFSGFFTFQNTCSGSVVETGFFTFGNHSDFELIDTGFFTFQNTSQKTQITTGFFVFGNTSRKQLFSTGYFVFGNASRNILVVTGHFTFGNIAQVQSISLGFFAFGNTAQFEQVSTGFFTFSNTSQDERIVHGYFTFGNTSQERLIIGGYFILSNSSSKEIVTSGFFAFGNTSQQKSITSGYFTFSNISYIELVDSGYFTFGNVVVKQSVILGYFVFQNISQDELILSGYFTFTNISNDIQITSGFFTFSNTSELEQIVQGFFTFSNIIQSQQTINGYFTFQNDSRTRIVSDGFFIFGNASQKSTITSGFFIFSNVASQQLVTSGFFAFGNIVQFQSIASGFFTFTNTSQSSSISSGYFTFTNSSQYEIVESGFFIFGNIISQQSVITGFFTFGNTTSASEITTGYFTFGSSASQQSVVVGYFTFNNVSNYVKTISGFFTFSNSTQPERMSSGFFTFQNSSSNGLVDVGFFVFSNIVQNQPVITGFFSFNNSLQNHSVASGFFTFGNTSQNGLVNTGYFVLSNTSDDTRIVSGYFTFENTATRQSMIDGYFSFQNSTQFQQIATGYFTFQNVSQDVRITTGFFSFGNFSIATQAVSGYFTFENVVIFTNVASGFFTFSNVSQSEQIIQGYFTFSNASYDESVVQGFFTFGDISQITMIQSGFFAFSNTIQFTQITSGFFNFQNVSQEQLISSGFFTLGSVAQDGLMSSGYFTFSNSSQYKSVTDGYFTFQSLYITIVNTSPVDESGVTVALASLHFNYTCVETTDWNITFENLSDDGLADSVGIHHHTLDISSYDLQPSTTYYWYLSFYIPDLDNWVNFTLEFSTGRVWQKEVGGFFTFSNTSSDTKVKSGFFTFTNISQDILALSGFFTFSNTTSLSSITDGYFTFSNTTQSEQITTGFFTFSNTSRDKSTILGYFTFTNSTGNKQISSGFFSFSNTSDYNIIESGFFTFSNIAIQQQFISGFFTFIASGESTQVQSGFFVFSNSSYDMKISTGFFTFQNTTTDRQVTSGFFTFSNIPLHRSEINGFFTFQNTSHKELITSGFFIFGNTTSELLVTTGFFVFSSVSDTQQVQSGFFAFANDTLSKSITDGYFLFNAIYINVLNTTPEDNTGTTTSLASLHFNYTCVTDTDWNITFENLSNDGLADSTGTHHHSLDISTYDLQSGQIYQWNLSFYITDIGMWVNFTYNFSTGRVYRLVTTGYFAFTNSTYENAIQSGFFVFTNGTVDNHLIMNGFFVFASTSQYRLVDTGFFTFTGSSDSTLSTSGFFVFSNSSVGIRTISGFFTFQNVSQTSSSISGFLTFIASGTSALSASGYFVFVGSSQDTLTTSGYFVFNNSDTEYYRLETLGYFTFLNVTGPIWQLETSGYFTFSNSSLSIQTQSGFFTFSGSSDFIIDSSGHFTFGNTSQNILVTSGHFTIQNTSRSKLISGGHFTFRNVTTVDIHFVYSISGCCVICKGNVTGVPVRYRWTESWEEEVKTGTTGWINYTRGDALTYSTCAEYTTTVNITLECVGELNNDSESHRIKVKCDTKDELNPETKDKPNPQFPEAKDYAEVPIGEWTVDAGSLVFLLIILIVIIVLWFKRKNRPPRGWKYAMP